MARLALNPIQWMASDDGWLDPSKAPERQELLSLVKQDGDIGGFQCIPELFYGFDEWVKRGILLAFLLTITFIGGIIPYTTAKVSIVLIGSVLSVADTIALEYDFTLVREETQSAQ